MSKPKKANGFDIPWFVIILAFIFQMWPLGVAMIFLRELPLKNKKASVQSNNSTGTVEAENAAQTVYASGRTQTAKTTRKHDASKKIKKSKAPLILKIVGWCLLGAGAITSVSALGDFISWGDWFYIRDILSGVWCMLGGGGCILTSYILRRRDEDAARYAAVIGDRDSVSLMKLSAVTSYKIGRVKRDLQRMIHRGDFGDAAYLDMANLCFMRSPDAIPDGVAEQYGTASYQRTMTSDAAFSEKSSDASSETHDAQHADTIEDTSDFVVILKKIRKLDDDIQDEDVSRRIREIEMITRNIFEYVKDNPEKMKQIRMFMNYYLPTTLKLLESYSRIERVGVAGNNMREAKENIEQILDMLVTAFRQQFDQLFKAESLDISSDIEVLEQMMNKDGLTGTSDFSFSNEEAFTDRYSDDLKESGGAAFRKME